MVDAHHHLWDQVNTARPGAALLNVDLAKFGIAEKLVRPPPAPPSRRPTASDVEIKKKLAGAIKQYGTVQEQLMDYLPEDLIADSVQESGVTLLGTVYLQCGWTDTSPGGQAGETAWADSVAKKTSGVVGTGIIGAINMTAPVEITERELLAHMKASPNFRGIRDMELARPRSAKELLTDPRVLANLKLFEKYNLVLDVTCYQWSLPALVEVANMFPRNTFGALQCLRARAFSTRHANHPPSLIKSSTTWDPRSTS